jgi:hypothetical protein
MTTRPCFGYRVEVFNKMDAAPTDMANQSKKTIKELIIQINITLAADGIVVIIYAGRSASFRSRSDWKLVPELIPGVIGPDVDRYRLSVPLFWSIYRGPFVSSLGWSFFQSKNIV